MGLKLVCWQKLNILNTECDAIYCNKKYWLRLFVTFHFCTKKKCDKFSWLINSANFLTFTRLASVAMHLRWSGMFSDSFIANWILNSGGGTLRLTVNTNLVKVLLKRHTQQHAIDLLELYSCAELHKTKKKQLSLKTLKFTWLGLVVFIQVIFLQND